MTQNDMVAVDELVREIARALVDEPAAVEVESVAGTKTRFSSCAWRRRTWAR